MNEIALQALTALLWPEGDQLKGPQVYWLLDGARDPDLAGLLRTGGLEYTCLFSGRLHPQLQAAAPYLVYLAANSPTTKLLLRRGWGRAWGILSVAAPDVTLVQQRLHFKKFLRVRTEDGRDLAFRYYDPRVLNTYLPTCTADEFHTLLGPLTAMIAEQPGGTSLRMFASDGIGMQVRERAIDNIDDVAGVR